MGIVYKVTSPSGKSYVGQTTRTFAERWSQRVNAANNNNKTGCRALNAAIRKYGAENFTVEILYDGPNENLDEEEETAICFDNTLHPRGYNLTLGGQNNGSVNYTEEMRQRISDNHRKEDGNYDLPIYLRYFE